MVSKDKPATETFTCPCGHTTDLINAVSRHLPGVFVCGKCGRDWERVLAGKKVVLIRRADIP